MAKTTGERSRQEANAQKARGWFRDAQQETYGGGQYRNSDGTPLKMRYELREARTQRAMEAQYCHFTLLSLGHLGCAEQEEARAILALLMRQTPDLFNWHGAEAELDAMTFDSVDADEVRMECLEGLSNIWNEKGK